MEKIRIKLINTGGRYFEIENSTENPWSKFLEYFTDSGYQFTGEKWNEEFDILVTNTHRWRYILQCLLFNIDKSRRILIIWEPRTTNKKMYRPAVINRYGSVFVPSKEWLTGKNIKYFNWPQRPAREISSALPELSSRKKKAIFIAANKVSTISRELYSLRRLVLSNEKSNKLIDVAGPGWNQRKIYIYTNVAKQIIKNGLTASKLRNLRNLNPSISNYLGFIEKKNDLIRDYQVSLVIENTPDYVSEKLFDALDAGAVTVYVGGTLKNFDLPNTMAIQTHPDHMKIIQEIEKLLNLDIETLRKIQEEQQLQYFKIQHNWNNKRVFHDLAVKIEKVINQN